MNNTSLLPNRRHFLKTAAALTGGIAGLSFLPVPRNAPTGPDDINIIGPKEGYSPQIGTLVSMMTWNRPPITNAVKGMTVEQLDFLLDSKANTIGALLYHLAATDAFYHEHGKIRCRHESG
jgi:hypothetical protein